MNKTASESGIFPGQSLADAKASMLGLRTLPAEPELDRAELVALSRWTGRYGPSCNIDGVDGLWIDIEGVAHLFGGEPRLLKELQSRLSMFGHDARLGLADTAGAAWALSRFIPGARIAQPGSVRECIAELPVEGLRLSQETVRMLKRLGLYRIGQLYDLPRANLALRFRQLGRKAGGIKTDGMAEAVLIRLDQALGEIREPRKPLEPIPPRCVRQVFPEPLISSAGVEMAVASAIAELCQMLTNAGEGARHVRLRLYRTDGTRAEVRIGTSGPNRDATHLKRLILERLAVDSLDLGFGADVLTLEATSVENLDASQPELGSRSIPAIEGLEKLIDRLSNRLEIEDIHRVKPVCTHIPELADITAPALNNTPHEHFWMTVNTPERPPFLLGRPEPIAVMAEIPEGAPRQFKWRRTFHSVLRFRGPERIEPEWWRGLGTVNVGKRLRPRDYYMIEDDKGGRYWVFREGLYDRDQEDGPPVWYVHGLLG